MTTASDLRCRVEVLRRAETVNEFGETTVTYETERKIWAQIVPLSGRRNSVPGGMEQMEVSHRFTVRRESLRKVPADLHLRFQGQVYTVQYVYPDYTNRGFVDVFCKLEVERGIQSF